MGRKVMFRRFDPEASRASAVSFTRLRLEDCGETSSFGGLLDLWRAKCGDRRVPARADFDPEELLALLPHLLLIDVCYDPPDFRYRLAGTRTRDIHGVELTGRSVLDIVPSDQGRLVWNDLCEMLERWEPQHVRLRFVNGRGLVRAYQVLRLPLSRDGSRIDMVMVMQNFGEQAELLQDFYATLRHPVG